MSKARKGIFIAAGMLFLALGTVGVFLPILPTVPLYLLAGVCFANGSERLNTWFQSTTLYKRNVGPLRDGLGMTMGAKIVSILIITALLTFAFVMMSNAPIWAKAILVAVEVFHLWLFFVKLPTATPQQMEEWRSKHEA